ncbi:hypothetical protein LWI29_020143 [Acer saccharum]|uniref:CCHC-type domain-containing protein n=1 Tax=Acer saccharum TaxID=4024 RepID=A0AA39S0U1_ACESA|nr:hypothetical protein LWI29_020143 [Acer saccharum]
MDRNIYEAAVDGSVTSLLNLLQQDALALDRFIVGCLTETPLHIASLLGHAEFVQEILSRKPELAGELDARKSSPLHLATAKGYLDIVKMLVSVNPKACSVCDRDGRNPLHIAAIKGHVSILKELVQISSDAVRMILMDRGETILHLCVRYNQLQVMQLLVESMHDHGFLNAKDDDGNTILHLAVADKQIEAIKFLTTKTATKVNAVNAYGFTALDLSTQSRKDVRDWEIAELLRHSGAMHAKDIQSPAHELGTTYMAINLTSHENHQTNALQQDQGCGNVLMKQNDWVEKMSSALMIVASLIATMAFQVAVNPPGGVWQEDSTCQSKAVDIGSMTNPSHRAGFSIMADQDPTSYRDSLAFNTTGFLTSISIILLLISGLPMSRRFFMWVLMVIMWIAISAMTFTYLNIVFALSRNSIYTSGIVHKLCKRRYVVDLALNSDEVDFKISTRIDGSIVEMIYDLDLQIFVSHNKENPKCYVSVFHKQLRSLVDQLTVTRDLKSKCTSITIGCTGDQACTPPPIVKCKSTGSPVVSSSGYRSTTGSNEFVPSGFPVDESKTPPSIRKSIFPQSPLGGTVSKKSANRSNHGNYAKDEKVHCPTVVTAEDEEGGMGCSANINSPLCPCCNEISPQDLPLRPTHDDNPLHLVDLVSLSASGINKNLSGPEHELKLRRRSGRQRKSIKYNQETCSNCSEKGHNKSGCRKPAFDASGPTKPPRTCSICHRPGHNRQTCPSGY